MNKDLVFCLRIIECISKIKLYASDFDSPLDFFNSNNQLNFNATLNLFSQIGENITKISKELKSQYNSVPWQKVKNFRNRIIHEYTGIDFSLTYQIIEENLPEFEQNIYEIIINEIKNGEFDIEDLKVAVGNQYYQNIDFTKFDI